MGKENAVSRPFTRSLASALRASEVTSTTQNQQRVNTKRPALEDTRATGPNKRKKRAVLGEITNVNSNTAILEAKNSKQIKKGRGHGLASTSQLATSVTSEVTDLQSRTDAKVEVASNTAGNLSVSKGTDNTADNCIEIWNSRLPPRPLGRSASTAEKSAVIGSSTVPDIPKFVDIDSDDKDPLLCCLYAPEIHYNLRVSELKRRPLPDFMERIQKDVTQSMRGILVDWLVEVSEEYTLASDTLYLTVYLIDWFLHGNYVQRQQLQLLGITCMLIASKYEEISAPRIEEFCFITDNTYTRDQVLEMENQVLKHFSFQIYTPTPKTFLRRFLRAAQASRLSPSLEVEFLASYLTELTLIDYHFLKFLPSVVAASAVFLAKWTMDQSNHPWNPTLEHYTTYKASDLKASVHALQDLQLNTKGCPLSAIRMKYRQEKYKSVAVLTSPKLLDTLF
ncbi:Cyclin-A2-3 [Arabidopsis thaliana]|uniref:Cyclin-A2-3 n=3 Tax=Arabidopsis TaxID=3701 RepID=CCA23_ARATH|nr:CYCLIN A2;3 [Arabidopsis thaliana]Q38819.2 RecName: Full=Cyclin-A2-3; AltName: Full=Cyc3c-At; AltName: Full=Cyclin-3c; AltName: Full=G2/mitotic-specific cyclin-A2-3; Short=CycA2;3 [Arabidopsis thaliana]KAG7646437.1 Cyclin C-terminal domain [Arabidopsis thaliana x Arabidopsis arenosa]AAL59927.1 putative cyclin [Arabidopsis thaliana]AAM20367.1 putative cyclin protein [Arabidopsis thaliana]AEE29336.1 CYCLIN A2;3 [Arabidopsis thaliana]OAP19794.1 CYCA2 [Arabidopsis thaliana]|eukprot:NP_173010.1 CYCLIN A2;3 [Arabidopsis thaliana]